MTTQTQGRVPQRILYSDRALDQFEQIYADAANSAGVTALVVHPYIMGAPHRLKYFRRVLETISQKSAAHRSPIGIAPLDRKRRDGRAPNFRQGTRRHCRRHAGAADAGRTLFALGRHLADDENRACRHSAAQQARADGCSRSALLTGHLPRDPHEAFRPMPGVMSSLLLV